MTGSGGPRFADLLRGYRRDRGLTQEALAELAGLSARGIRALEQGERSAPHRDTLELLAGALNLSAGQRKQFEATARHARAREAITDDVFAAPTGGYLGARPVGPLVAREAELAQALNDDESSEFLRGLILSHELGDQRGGLVQR